jgi:hypothetical protein
VAKKSGLLQPDDSLEDTTLQDYLDMYKKPLYDDSMQAILQLTEVAAEKKKKKKGKDKKTLPKSHNKLLAAGKMMLAKKEEPEEDEGECACWHLSLVYANLASCSSVLDD